MLRWMVLGVALLIAGCGLRPAASGGSGGVENFGSSQRGQGSGNGGS